MTHASLSETQATLLARLRERGGSSSHQLSAAQLRDARELVKLGYLVQRGPSARCMFSVYESVRLVSSN